MKFATTLIAALCAATASATTLATCAATEAETETCSSNKSFYNYLNYLDRTLDAVKWKIHECKPRIVPVKYLSGRFFLPPGFGIFYGTVTVNRGETFEYETNGSFTFPASVSAYIASDQLGILSRTRSISIPVEDYVLHCTRDSNVTQVLRVILVNTSSTNTFLSIDPLSFFTQATIYDTECLNKEKKNKRDRDQNENDELSANDLQNALVSPETIAEMMNVGELNDATVARNAQAQAIVPDGFKLDAERFFASLDQEDGGLVIDTNDIVDATDVV